MKCLICNHNDASHELEWFVTYEGFEPDDIKRGGVHDIEVCTNCLNQFNKDVLFVNQQNKTIMYEGKTTRCNNFSDFMQTWKFARHVLNNKGRTFKELVYCKQEWQK